jgi:hypothetical protein
MFYNKNRRGLGRSNQLTPRLMSSCLPARLTLPEIRTFVPKRHQRGYKHAHNMKSCCPFDVKKYVYQQLQMDRWTIHNQNEKKVYIVVI